SSSPSRNAAHFSGSARRRRVICSAMVPGIEISDVLSRRCQLLVRVGIFWWLPIGSTHREDGLNGDPDAGDDDDDVDCEQQPVGGSGGGEADELIDGRPER